MNPDSLHSMAEGLAVLAVLGGFLAVATAFLWLFGKNH